VTAAPAIIARIGPAPGDERIASPDTFVGPDAVRAIEDGYIAARREHPGKVLLFVVGRTSVAVGDCAWHVEGVTDLDIQHRDGGHALVEFPTERLREITRELTDVGFAVRHIRRDDHR
jgi:hypothetical protein